MTVKLINNNDTSVAFIEALDTPLKTAQDALDMIATISYDYKCSRIALDKSYLTEDFFKLSTGIAGEMLQKFINYHAKVAIIGDFSGYTSKPLKDFIYECNSGNDIFFVATHDEAIERLSRAR